MPRIVYSPRYNIGFYGLERLHPFDSRKYGRAWRVLRSELGETLKQLAFRTDRGINRGELSLVHNSAYLRQIKESSYVAGALELPLLARLPAWMIDWHVLRPMRWATRGTLLAAEASLSHDLAINLGGGFHHAKPTQGEGFCIYSDIGIAVESLRARGLIQEDSRVVYVDIDAHQGNGVCHTFLKDNRVFIFDIYNSTIYPASDIVARNRIDCDLRVTGTCTESEYLSAVRERLPGFIDSVCNEPVSIAIYNAGTDVLKGDPLGGLNLSKEAILERDLYVVGELRKRKLPTLMVLSGGYTKQSYQLVADSVVALVRQWAE